MGTASPSTRLSCATHYGRGIQAAAALAWREWIRFVRQRNRVIGAAVQPVVFWLLFGAGLGPSFSLPGEATAEVSYFQYFFPGTLLLILLFAAIFTTISIIEDRREGFLQSVLVAPLPRWSMVAGKLLGGTMIALVHAIPFLVLGLVTSGIFISVFQLFAVLLWLGLVGLQMVALGFSLAWRMSSVQGFHAIMNLLLMPMWLLSGAFFPVTTGPLRFVAIINPLSYSLSVLRRLFYLDATPAIRDMMTAGLPTMTLSICVTLIVTFLACVMAWILAKGRSTGEQP